MIRTLNAQNSDFWPQLNALLAFETVNDTQLLQTVDGIIADIKHRGDEALLEYTKRFDHHPAQSMSELCFSMDDMRAAFDALSADLQHALQQAAKRIQTFHQQQTQPNWSYVDELGNRLGQQVTPLDKVGIYVPGGKAVYPSSVLMNAIPAVVAGVSEVMMVVPAPHGELNPMVLAAAHVAGVHRIFAIGGAQAVAALAYGTATVPKVDKITGPGNRYVAAAKRAVFGTVGIDMIAGPSEILVYAETGNPEWIAMDLLSQAEHDEVAQSILVTTNAELAQAVQQAIDKQLQTLPRADIARTSLANRGAVIVADTQAQVIEIINKVAPEHLELMVDNPDALLPFIRHAGAIFMGLYSPEAIGDYCAGPNHVLPTSGTARFSSPLGVYDFQKRSSVIYCSEAGAKPLAAMADILAQEEGLMAHALSARFRR